MPRSACPICHGISNMLYDMRSKDSQAKWRHCACGCVFNDEPSGKPLSEMRIKEINDIKEYKAKCRHFVMTYAPIVEELAAGRQYLEIEPLSTHLGDALKERGWVDNPEAERYDFIFSNHTLENQKDPVKHLIKMKHRLSDTGVLLIATSDTDFIHVLSPANWGNWNNESGNVYFNLPSLSLLIERMGLQVILAMQNISCRFTHMNDLHILARRKIV